MERRIKPTGLCSKFEEGGFGHVKIYLEPIVRVYKDISNEKEKESDKIGYKYIKSLKHFHQSGMTYSLVHYYISHTISNIQNIPIFAKVISSWQSGCL